MGSGFFYKSYLCLRIAETAKALTSFVQTFNFIFCLNMLILVKVVPIDGIGDFWLV